MARTRTQLKDSPWNASEASSAGDPPSGAPKERSDDEPSLERSLHHDWGRILASLGVALAAVIALMASAWLKPLDATSASEPSLGKIENAAPMWMPRPVRVLLVRQADRVLLRCAGTIIVLDDRRRRLDALALDEWTPCRAEPQGLRIGSMSWSGSSFILMPSPRPIQLARPAPDGWELGARYPGWMRVERDDGGLRVINEVDLEDYVAGVVGREIRADFHPHAFRAQAIAARSFVLYQMLKRSREAYDVTCDQSSQVYGGWVSGRAGALAQEAAQATRGVICVYPGDSHDLPFPTYYGAACGGVSASTSIDGDPWAIPPLAGGVRCEYCRAAPPQVYRWDPITLPLEEVRDRLRRRYPELRTLEPLRHVQILERTPQGRLARLRLFDRLDQTFDLSAERFRLAIGSRVMKSVFCRLRVIDGQLILDEGKGFGHGMGLCQWGMQGQALRGRTAAQILSYYFPDSQLVRLHD